MKYSSGLACDDGMEIFSMHRPCSSQSNDAGANASVQLSQRKALALATAEVVNSCYKALIQGSNPTHEHAPFLEGL